MKKAVAAARDGAFDPRQDIRQPPSDLLLAHPEGSRHLAVGPRLRHQPQELVLLGAQVDGCVGQAGLGHHERRSAEREPGGLDTADHVDELGLGHRGEPAQSELVVKRLLRDAAEQ